MAWRYTFDGGPEKGLDCKASQYCLAAMAAFANETIEKLPTIKGPGTFPYDGHVLVIWNDKLIPEYGPYHYGIGLNECVSLTIVTLLDQR